MSTVHVSSPASNSLNGFAADMAAMESEIIARQMQAEAERIERMMELQRRDDCQCRGCQQPTEGLTICGIHVPVCPDCFAAYVEASDKPVLA